MTKKTWLSVTGLVLAMALFAGIWLFTRPDPNAGKKDITVEVVHGDGSARPFEISTEEEYLGRALVEHGIVEENQSSYGLYILTADGETANEMKQEWWRLTKAGEELMTGADEVVIADGEHYELTLTVGYDG